MVDAKVVTGIFVEVGFKQLVATVGIGGGIYLVANLGPGPRDGLMIGLQKKTNFPIRLVF